MAEKKATTMWEELRKPFPKEVVGKLPKPYSATSPKSKCSECNGYHGLPAVHLDYIGHAAVTDRLNVVCGPQNWDWQPLSTDDNGLPKTDARGNLWIKLMIREGAESPWVTRLGYGDGSSSMKELIGDALRNAGMRFGIALDLWSKEELESTLADPTLKNDKPSSSPTAKPAVGSAPMAAPKPDVMTPNQLKMLMALFNELGVIDRDERIGYIAKAANRAITSAKDLTKSETAQVIDQLQSDVSLLTATPDEVDDADIASLLEGVDL